VNELQFRIMLLGAAMNVVGSLRVTRYRKWRPWVDPAHV
jgi:hypothetical protein